MADQPKAPGQLELPLLATVPAQQTPLSHATARESSATRAGSPRPGGHRAAASEQDLAIYRSISDNYFRKTK